MDKEQLAKKLYNERVTELMGESIFDAAQLEQLWKDKASPQEAVKVLREMENQFSGAPWLQRYLERK